MTKSESVFSLIARWEAANEAGRRLPLEEVCENQQHLVGEVRVGLEKLGYQLGTVSEGINTTKPESNVFAESTIEYPQVHANSNVDQIPSKIGPYRVLKLLGEGGMGSVFAAEDAALNRQVALKVMKPAVAATPIARERFLREARAAASLSHDNILPILHVGEHAGQPYIVMPLLRGETLEARLKRGALSCTEFIQLVVESTQGLASAHATGLIHRDIKPSNMWLEEISENKWRVKLLDFGLARSVSGGDQLTHSGSLMGSPPYMSPEQVNEQKLDHRSDLFSLGVVLYEAVTGISPFRREVLTATMRAVSEYDPPALELKRKDIPGELAKLVHQMLEKEKEKRPGSASEIGARMKQCQAKDNTVSENHLVADKPANGSGIQLWHKIVATCAVLVVALFLFLLPKSARPTGIAASSKPSEEGQTPKFKGSIDFKVMRNDVDGNEIMIPLNDPRAVPLYAGDYFIIDATIEPEAFVYLFWIDTEGKVDPVFPWKAGQWGTRPAKEVPVKGKFGANNDSGRMFKISGTDSGMESLIMLARFRSPLPENDEVIKQWFQNVPAQPLLKDRPQARLWFENFSLMTKDNSRAPDWGGSPVDSPMFKLQAHLAKQLGSSVDYSLSVTFTKLGIKRE